MAAIPVLNFTLAMDFSARGSGMAARGGLPAASGMALYMLGQQGQRAVTQLYGVAQNLSLRIPSILQAAQYRVPDILNHLTLEIGEIKNVAYQGWTSQMADYALWAIQ